MQIVSPCLRRVVISTLAMLCLAVSAGCGSEDSGSGSGSAAAGSTSDKPVRIAFFMPFLANTYSGASLQAAKKVAKRENATIKVFDGALDPKKQFAQVQDATTSQQFDAFVVVAIGGAGIRPALEQAVAQDIKVATLSLAAGPKLDTPAPQVEGVSASVMDPPKSRGTWLGNLAKSACENQDPCKVILMPGTTDLPVDVTIANEFKAVVGNDPSIEIVATEAGGYLAQPALKATQDLLQAHPDVNVIAAGADQMTVGVALALKKFDRKAGTGPDDVKIIGLGASRPAVKGIRDGTWFGTVLSLPYEEGEIGTKAVIDAVRGKLPKPLGVSAAEESGLPLEMTKENIGDFESKWDG